jgi:hypothetical protein
MSDNLDFSFNVLISGEAVLEKEGRLSRINWLAHRIRNDDFFLMQDGSYSKLLFTELLECYISGQFTATTILGFTLIERSIAGRLSHVGQASDAQGKSDDLLKSALAKNWITNDEYNKLDGLRKVRNPLVHFRPHLASTRPEVRAAENGRDVQLMLERDAKEILEAAIHLLGKTAL